MGVLLLETGSRMLLESGSIFLQDETVFTGIDDDMAFGDILNYQRWNRSKTANLTYAATDTTGTLITCRGASDQIWVQKITYTPGTVAGQAITVKDTAGTPVIVGVIPASQATPITLDFGPKGFPLTIGTNLVVASTAGAGGVFHVEAYEKLGAVVSSQSGAALQ